MNKYRRLKKLRRNAEYLKGLRYFQKNMMEERDKDNIEGLFFLIKEVKKTMRKLLECNK